MKHVYLKVFGFFVLLCGLSASVSAMELASAQSVSQDLKEFVRDFKNINGSVSDRDNENKKFSLWAKFTLAPSGITTKVEAYNRLCDELKKFSDTYEDPLLEYGSLTNFFIEAVRQGQLKIEDILIFRNRVIKLDEDHNCFRAMKSYSSQDLSSQDSESPESPKSPKSSVQPFNDPYLNTSMRNALIYLSLLELRDFAWDAGCNALGWVKRRVLRI